MWATSRVMLRKYLENLLLSKLLATFITGKRGPTIGRRRGEIALVSGPEVIYFR